MARKGGNPDIGKVGKHFTSANANEMRLLGLSKKRDNKEREEWMNEYVDLALSLAALDPEEFDHRIGHPTSKAEEILLDRLGNPDTAYATLRDFATRVLGTPKQSKDIPIGGNEGGKVINVYVGSKEAAEAAADV